MSVFQHRQSALHCEGVPLETIAEAHGTPTYVYSRQAIESAFLAYQTALADRPHLICYAVKANRPSVNHNEECRARMEVALGSVGDPRVQKVLEDAAAQEIEEDMPDPEDDPTDLFADIEGDAEDMSVAGSTDEVFSLGVDRSLMSLTANLGSVSKFKAWELGINNTVSYTHLTLPTKA